MATATLADQDDLVGVITKDHREVERIFAELEPAEETHSVAVTWPTT
jgi:hypothetical protein